MGALLKALSPVSSYSAKQTGLLWDEITDRIAGALLPLDLDELDAWLEAHELEIPTGWREPIAELIDKRRDELQAEEVGEILRDRFDF